MTWTLALTFSIYTQHSPWTIVVESTETCFPLAFKRKGRLVSGSLRCWFHQNDEWDGGMGITIWYWSALIGNIQFSSISQDSDSIHLIGYPMPSRCSSQIHPVRGRCFALYVISCCLTTAFNIARIIFVWNIALIPNRRTKLLCVVWGRRWLFNSKRPFSI